MLFKSLKSKTQINRKINEINKHLLELAKCKMICFTKNKEMHAHSLTDEKNEDL